MHKLDADAYYEDRPVLHTAQGDIFSGVPCTWAIPLATDSTPERGSRKRPANVGIADVPDFAELTHPADALAIVCNYTCGFVAQPPGTPGYAHPFRLMAPVVPLGLLVTKYGLSKGEARRVYNDGGLAGLMYLPTIPDYLIAQNEDDEFGGALVACLYRMTAVDQGILDRRTRVARLSAQAQQLLICRLIQVVSPNFPDVSDGNLQEPDMSCSWSA